MPARSVRHPPRPALRRIPASVVARPSATAIRPPSAWTIHSRSAGLSPGRPPSEPVGLRVTNRGPSCSAAAGCGMVRRPPSPKIRQPPIPRLRPRPTKPCAICCAPPRALAGTQIAAGPGSLAVLRASFRRQSAQTWGAFVVFGRRIPIERAICCRRNRAGRAPDIRCGPARGLSDIVSPLRE
jgi:hypothetical protein